MFEKVAELLFLLSLVTPVVALVGSVLMLAIPTRRSKQAAARGAQA